MTELDKPSENSVSTEDNKTFGDKVGELLDRTSLEVFNSWRTISTAATLELTTLGISLLDPPKFPLTLYPIIIGALAVESLVFVGSVDRVTRKNLDNI